MKRRVLQPVPTKAGQYYLGNFLVRSESRAARTRRR
jgi:hypothetical protein